MKLIELLIETAAPSNTGYTVRYVTRKELDTLMSKYKFVPASKYYAFGYNDPNVRKISNSEFMAAMLSDIPVRATAEQMLPIAQRISTDWPHAIVDTMMSYKSSDIYESFNSSNPTPDDPTKRPILITTFATWVKEIEEYLDENSEDEYEDDFEENQ